MLVAESINSFGAMLKYLRRSARLTQRDLGQATGYTEAHICRLGKNMRPPDVATLAALFVPALELESRPELTGRLLQLASEARRAPPPPAWPLAVAPQAGGHHHPAPAPALRAGRSAAPDAAHWRGRVQLSRGADPGPLSSPHPLAPSPLQVWRGEGEERVITWWAVGRLGRVWLHRR
ncbi:helix-turn-helix transcriptional regulator [Candidatus Amarolinea dominans]|uniref:helix-turn-helix domain-containing protein n=1 Tax=Candidatus Amarolinea dominans TaxID=3140696 RepID=UPI003135531C|nr:helix-turn-helix transcriptional regulator [Anaerolineae bacterium]